MDIKPTEDFPPHQLNSPEKQIPGIQHQGEVNLITEEFVLLSFHSPSKKKKINFLSLFLLIAIDKEWLKPQAWSRLQKWACTDDFSYLPGNWANCQISTSTTNVYSVSSLQLWAIKISWQQRIHSVKVEAQWHPDVTFINDRQLWGGILANC